MHAEHAELIAALRRENFDLNRRLADMGDLKTICNAQEVVMERAQRTLLEQGKVIERQLEIIRELTAKLEEAMRCP